MKYLFSLEQQWHIQTFILSLFQHQSLKLNVLFRIKTYSKQDSLAHRYVHFKRQLISSLNLIISPFLWILITFEQHLFFFLSLSHLLSTSSSLILLQESYFCSLNHLTVAKFLLILTIHLILHLNHLFQFHSYYWCHLRVSKQ